MLFFNKYKKYIRYCSIIICVILGGLIYTLLDKGKAKSLADLSFSTSDIELSVNDNNSESINSSDKAKEYSGADNYSQNGAQNSVSNSAQNDSQKDLQEGKATDTAERIYIYVCGEVNKPDVYQCIKGSRMYEVIEQAGGFTQEADTTYLNLVQIVNDGQKIYVPKAGEVISDLRAEGDAARMKINLNTASKEELMTLPGIGEARAADIIQSRIKEGLFKSCEDIKRINGIKEAAYQKIMHLITV